MSQEQITVILKHVFRRNQSGNHIFLLQKPMKENPNSSLTENKEILWMYLFVLLHLKQSEKQYTSDPLPLCGDLGLSQQNRQYTQSNDNYFLLMLASESFFSELFFIKADKYFKSKSRNFPEGDLPKILFQMRPNPQISPNFIFIFY